MFLVVINTKVKISTILIVLKNSKNYSSRNELIYWKRQI